MPARWKDSTALNTMRFSVWTLKDSRPPPSPRSVIVPQPTNMRMRPKCVFPRNKSSRGFEPTKPIHVNTVKIMKALLTLFKTNDSFIPLIARLTLGLVMFPHGAQKALGWFGGSGFSGTMNFFIGQMHIPALFAFLAIAAEFAGSIGLITGFFSRVAAFGIAVNMLV